MDGKSKLYGVYTPERRTDQRMHWVLMRCIWPGLGGMVAWDADDVDAFLDEFPESKKATRYYTLGSHSCPMLNRAAVRARDLGYLRPGVIGCDDARSFNQRTWSRYWSVTPAGWQYLRETEPEAVAAYCRRNPDDKVG